MVKWGGGNKYMGVTNCLSEYVNLSIVYVNYVL